MLIGDLIKSFNKFESKRWYKTHQESTNRNKSRVRGLDKEQIRQKGGAY